MKCPIEPLGDKIVILPQEEGEVPNRIKVGQTVLVPKFGAQVVVVENETYIVASENDVLGIIKNKENE